MQNYYLKFSPDGDPLGHPVSEQNLRQCHPVNIDAKWLADNDYKLIENTPPENLEANQYAERTGTYEATADGGLQWVYEVITLDQDYLTNRYIRIPRVQKLAETDWAVLPDSPLSETDKQAYLTYRQALRDLTSTYPNVTSAEDVTWPTAPWEYTPAEPPSEE
jgi:hypothetical protein